MVSIRHSRPAGSSKISSSLILRVLAELFNQASSCKNGADCFLCECLRVLMPIRARSSISFLGEAAKIFVNCLLYIQRTQNLNVPTQQSSQQKKGGGIKYDVVSRRASASARVCKTWLRSEKRTSKSSICSPSASRFSRSASTSQFSRNCGSALATECSEWPTGETRNFAL